LLAIALNAKVAATSALDSISASHGFQSTRQVGLKKRKYKCNKNQCRICTCFWEQSRQFTTMGIIYLFAFIGSAEKLYKNGIPFFIADKHRKTVF